MDDVIVLGAGAAGLSAALYAARRALKVVVLTKDIGGQTATTTLIENYPGMDRVDGPELMLQFKSQAEKYGTKVIADPAVKVVPVGKEFEVTTESGKVYSAKSVILTVGKTHRHLGIPGETEFANKGVVYCATCDAPLFAGKTVAIVGGGNSAVDAALLLAKIAKSVYLIHRRNEFKAEAVLVERLKFAANVKLILEAAVESVHGTSFVESIKVKQLTTGEVTDLSVDGLFVEIGYQTQADFLSELVKLNPAGEIIIDAYNQTSHPGIFAAGDATSVPYKQTVISAGEGAKAALSAYNYLMGASPDTAVADHYWGN